jgi:hypothetical protein
MTSAKPSVSPIRWTYDQSDPALMLWTASLQRWPDLFVLPSAAQVVELGCADTNFLERFSEQNPDATIRGVEWCDQYRDRTIIGDACDPDLFQPNSLDAVIMLGALEHFGLGYYGDPLHQDNGQDVGDMLAMQNVESWLKPGGWVYFDVPCQPVGGIRPNRHFRDFSPQDVTDRLIAPGLTEVCRGYSWPEPNAGTWCDEPTGPLTPYWFAVVVARKDA